jgi:hypothetical protein
MRQDSELWSLDECHCQQHGTRTRMGVPPEIKDPVLFHAPTRQSVACFGAVSVQTGKFIRSISPTFNARTFEAFLKKLLRHRARGRRMVVVLDNARYHHAVLLAPLRRKYRRVLTLLFLPPVLAAPRPDRAGLEARTTHGHPQPVFRHPGRPACGRRSMLRQMDKTQSGAATVMLHYLRRSV